MRRCPAASPGAVRAPRAAKPSPHRRRERCHRVVSIDRIASGAYEPGGHGRISNWRGSVSGHGTADQASSVARWRRHALLPGGGATGLLRLDILRAEYPTPLLGFVGNEVSELGSPA